MTTNRNGSTMVAVPLLFLSYSLSLFYHLMLSSFDGCIFLAAHAIVHSIDCNHLYIINLHILFTSLTFDPEKSTTLLCLYLAQECPGNFKYGVLTYAESFHANLKMAAVKN
jgi:hypothetical protein